MSLHRRILPTLVAALLTTVPAPRASALGIGEWRALSHIGERALAEAEIFSEAGELIDNGCFRLLHVGSDGEFPAIEDARIQVISAAGGLRLRLESNHAVREPIVQIRLKMMCGGAQTRDMVLLFSPREYAPTPIVPPPIATPAVAGSERLSVPLRRTPADNGPGATRRSISVGATTERPKSNRAVSRPAARTMQSREAPRLVLSGELDPATLERLRLTTELRSPPKQATDVEREQLRRLYRSMMQLAELKEQPGQAPASPPEGISSTPPTIPPPSDASNVVPATPPPAATPPDHKAMPPDTPKATPLPPLGLLDAWWQPLLGMLIIAALLGMMLWFSRRRRSIRVMPEPIEPMPSIHQASIKSEAIKADDTLEALITRDKPVDLQASDEGQSAFANVHGVTVHSETPAFLTSYRTMLDLADSMMAFGLVSDAADALKEYVDEHPDVAVEPWLKLLDVLRHSGKRTEFDQYSTRLRQHFNLDLPDWDAPSTQASASGQANAQEGDPEARFRDAPSPLEAFPHVRDRLVKTWATPECASYLQHLLRDNRAGKRRGFPLIIIDDILLLIDITQELTGVDAKTAHNGKPEIFSDTW